jgi:hypothetical protein
MKRKKEMKTIYTTRGEEGEGRRRRRRINTLGI